MEATTPAGNLDVVPVGPLVDEDPPVDSPAWVELYASALAQYREQREQTEREQEQAQQLWDEFLRLQGQDVPEGGRSLVTNEALHRELKRLAMTAEAASYERENVIGDPNQTFGIEIEFDGANPNAVARALHEAGLASSASFLRPHDSRTHGNGHSNLNCLDHSWSCDQGVRRRGLGPPAKAAADAGRQPVSRDRGVTGAEAAWQPSPTNHP